VKSLVGLACALVASLAQAAGTSTQVYPFQVLLDGRPIGEHRFTVVTDGAERRVTSEARFKVTMLGFTAYRYGHRAEERWSGDCLDSLAASTDDDGKASEVRLVRAGEVAEVTAGGGHASVAGCLMTYAYWNPAMLSQSRLLNPQTGKVDAVRMERVGTGRIAVRGSDVDAVHWRVSGGEAPVDVWFSCASGQWVGLDSTVSGGKRTLSYRLR
jgi:hypothetical protein